MRETGREPGREPTGSTVLPDPYRALAAARLRCAALAAVAQALHQGEGVREVLGIALRCAAQALNAVDGSVFLFEGDDRDHLHGAAELLPLGRVGLDVSSGGSPGRLKALIRRQPVLLGRSDASGDEVFWFRRSGARWSITAPLCVGSRALGLLLLNFSAEAAPDEAALELAGLVASQCAIAIDRARVGEERERLLREVRDQAARLEADVAALRAIEERRDDLVRTISHDLRTPLTAIHGQAQLLAKRAEQPDQVRQGAAAIVTSANRMNVLIQDLVDMSRAECGQIRLEPRPVPLLPFLEELRERFRWALDVDRLHFEVGPEVPPLVADPGRLERVLLNLLSNALKYSPAGSPVEVRAAVGEGGVTLEVEDRGLGIEPEDLPRVFDRFFRSGRVRKTEGLGLGLYISRLIVEAHGGTLEVRSVPGQGSVFTARFPSEG